MSDDGGQAGGGGLRQMPWDADAEKGVLSCFLQDPVHLLPRAAVDLGEGETAFYSPPNQVLYRVMQEFSRSTDKPVEYVALTNYLRDAGLLEKIGGPGVLSELLNFVPTTAHYGYYVGILRGKQLLRRLIQESVESVNRAHDCHDVTKAGEVVSDAEARVFQVVSEAQGQGAEGGHGPLAAGVAVQAWEDHMNLVIRNRGKILGLTTGLHDLDRTIHGLDDGEGEIMEICGRPAMGKTAAGCTIVDHLALEAEWWDAAGGRMRVGGVPGAVFSIEMSTTQWLTRQVLGGCRIDTSKAHTGMFSRAEIAAFMERRALLDRAPLWFDDSPGLTTAELRAKVQVLKRKHGIRWIMVDHLHLVRAVGEQGQRDERMRLVEVMETLQYVKKQFRVVVFLMVQMNRESDRNAGKLPVLADLSGSAAIEQYADHVVFIHRPAYYKPWHKLSEEEREVWETGHGEQRRRNPECWSDGGRYPAPQAGGCNDWARQDYEEHALLVLRKNRRGPTPELAVRFQGEFTRFSSRTPRLYSGNEADRQVGGSEK